MRQTWLYLMIEAVKFEVKSMILETIVKAIKDSGKTRYQIGQDTGIDQTVLFRIFHGGSCSVQTADLLCEYLVLELKPKKRQKRVKK